MPALPDSQMLLATLRKQEKEMVKTLGALVRLESPSLVKAAVDRCGERVAAEWHKRGARIEFLRQKHRGNHLRVTLGPAGRKAKGQLLILGHLDTVYDIGTLQRMPFRIAKARAWGPGAFDTKAGILQALLAADALDRTRTPPGKRGVCLRTSDQETVSAAPLEDTERQPHHPAPVFSP